MRLVPRPVFLDLLKREPMMAEGLLRTLAELVRAGNARHADFVGLDVPGRLAKWLLKHTDNDRPGTNVTLRCSQGELAAELGTTRSALNRALHGFESLGLITVTGSRITVREPDALRFYTS